MHLKIVAIRINLIILFVHQIVVKRCPILLISSNVAKLDDIRSIGHLLTTIWTQKVP